MVDEAQTMPLPLQRPCVAALKELARNYGSSVVLCTATQPALEEAPAPGQRVFVVGSKSRGSWRRMCRGCSPRCGAWRYGISAPRTMRRSRRGSPKGHQAGQAGVIAYLVRRLPDASPVCPRNCKGSWFA